MKTLLTLILLAASVKSFGHGEDKLGPNGGYLKMPGGFHTEVVPEKDGKLKVFLLDINFKSPVVKNSTVTVTINNGTKKDIKCTNKRDHFLCETTKADLSKGTLNIVAVRSTVKGAEAVYELPLALAKSGTEMKGEDHGSHH